MPLTAVQPGMACVGKTVLQGTQISDFNLQIVDIVGAGGDARILARASGPGVDATGVAQGFSGSPVYCPTGDGGTAIAGAVSAGTGDYGNLLILITPIETMLAEPTTAAPTGNPLKVVTMTGVTGPVAAAVQKAALRNGRQLVVAPGVSRSLTLDPQASLVPGSSVAVGYSTGAIAASAVGTVTYVDGNRIWAFGHPLEGAGRRQLLLQNAYVHAVVGNPLTLEGATPFKLASPTGVIGTLTDDRLAGVSGVTGTLPRTFPLTVSVRNTETGKLTFEKTELTDEIAVGSPVSALDEIAPVAVAQAAVNALHGAPTQMVARMCVRIRLVGRTKTIKFCNRYIGGGPESPGGGMPFGIASAVGRSSAYERTPLHVADVDVQIRAAQKPATADIRKVTVTPRRARPGSRVLVRVEAVVAGTGDRIVRQRKVRVPGGYDAGDVLDVEVLGSAGGSGELAALEELLSSIFGSLGEDDEELDLPRTVDQVAKSSEGLASDDRAKIYIEDSRTRLPLLNVDDLRLTGSGETELTIRR